MKKRPCVFSSWERSLIAVSVTAALVMLLLVSLCGPFGIADVSQVSMPCESPLHGRKYQCEGTPIVWMPAFWKRSAMKTFPARYVLKCAPLRTVSLGYLPISMGAMLFPVYEAIAYMRS